jgi:hypothetical protein
MLKSLGKPFATAKTRSYLVDTREHCECDDCQNLQGQAPEGAFSLTKGSTRPKHFHAEPTAKNPSATR